MSTAPLSLRRATPTVSLLLLAAAASWLGVLAISRDMGSMPGTMGLGVASFVGVWTLMMAAMMLPSVVPFASLYTSTLRDRHTPRTASFILGYLIVWSAAALPAYLAAWSAERLLDGHPTAATALAAAILVTCGIYQLTPLKARCLAHCRSPLGFLLKYASYRGMTRDLRVGVHHGAYCLACCWALMLLLLVFGLMNVAAMVLLAFAVLMEKTWSRGPGFSRALGVAALVLAVLVLCFPGVAPGLDHSTTTAHMGSM